MSAIQKAVDFLGTQEKLATALGITQGRVSQWIKGELVDIKYFGAIHRVTEGTVTPEELLAEQLEKVDSGPGLN